MSEVFFNKESEEDKKCLDFYELDNHQFDELKVRVEKWHGLLRVFVHPGGDLYDEEKEKIKNIFFRILDGIKDEMPPVLILEEQSFIDVLREGLNKRLGEEDNSPYFIETLDHHSYPKDSRFRDMDNREGALAVPGSENFDKDKHYISTVMLKFTDYLKSLGVKKLLIGGNNLVYDEQYKYFTECVGNLIESIKDVAPRDFEIEVSEATMPLSGKDFRVIKRGEGGSEI